MRVVRACTSLLVRVRMYTQMLTLTAVLIQTCKRQLYTFRTKNTKEGQGGHSETVGIEGHRQDSLRLPITHL